MTGVRDYRDLVVWQKSMDLVTRVYRSPPGEEDNQALPNLVAGIGRLCSLTTDH